MKEIVIKEKYYHYKLCEVTCREDHKTEGDEISELRTLCLVYFSVDNLCKTKRNDKALGRLSSERYKLTYLAKRNGIDYIIYDCLILLTYKRKDVSKFITYVLITTHIRSLMKVV